MILVSLCVQWYGLGRGHVPDRAAAKPANVRGRARNEGRGHDLNGHVSMMQPAIRAQRGSAPRRLGRIRRLPERRGAWPMGFGLCLPALKPGDQHARPQWAQWGSGARLGSRGAQGHDVIGPARDIASDFPASRCAPAACNILKASSDPPALALLASHIIFHPSHPSPIPLSPCSSSYTLHVQLFSVPRTRV